MNKKITTQNKRAKMNKKGFFFTILAASLIAILFLLMKPTGEYSGYNKIPSIESRLNYINKNLKIIKESFIPYALIDTTRRAMIVYNQYLVREKKSPADSVDKARKDLREIIWNNTVDNKKINDSSEVPNPTDNLLENESLNVRFKIISDYLYNNLKINITFSVIDIDVFQDNTTKSDKLGVSLNYSLLLNASPLAYWKANITQNVTVPIIGLNDTYYYFNTKENGASAEPAYIKYGKLKQTEWNYNNFMNFMNNREYIFYKGGLSYLHRLANSTEDIIINGDHLRECCGLLTVINKGDSYLNSTGLYYNRSFVDFCYFNDNCSVSKDGVLVNFTDISSDDFPFKLHISQAQYFNLGDYIDEVQ